MNDAYTYDDVLIQPGYSDVRSRSTDVDISTKLGAIKMRVPVITSNMKTITGPKMAANIAAYGGLGILHRFCTIEDNVSMYIESANEFYDICNDIEMRKLFTLMPGDAIINIGVSIGVKDEDKKRFDKLYAAGARIFCIDVAHGHHILVKEMLNWISSNSVKQTYDFRKGITIIAGNIATPEAYEDMAEWGADVVKVGIGSSPVCRTRYNTGVGIPQLYALDTIYTASLKCENPPAIIADGGIDHPGNVAKALKFSDAVMIGSMIAGSSETPGDVYRNEDGNFYKVYGGSASGENKGNNRFVEGIIKTVEFRGHVKYIFREIEQGIESAFSYVGAHNHTEFQQKCKLVKISIGSQKESKI